MGGGGHQTKETFCGGGMDRYGYFLEQHIMIKLECEPVNQLSYNQKKYNLKNAS